GDLIGRRQSGGDGQRHAVEEVAPRNARHERVITRSEFRLSAAGQLLQDRDRALRRLQSGLMFAFSTMRPNCAASRRTRASSCAELDPIVSTPSAAKRALTSAMSKILTSSALSLSMIGCGVRAGANSAVQIEASTSATPSCCRVGQSGLNLDGLAEATASTRTRPVLMCGATEELELTASGTSPAASAFAAGAPPLYGMCWNWVPVLSAIH